MPILPPQPPPKRKTAWPSGSVFVAIVLVIVFGGARVWVSDYRDHVELGNTAEVIALDHRWFLGNVEWIPFMGQWELSVVVAPKRSYSEAIGLTALSEDSLRGLCGAILSNLPHQPEATVKRDDIFRLSLNYWQVEDGKVTGTTTLPTPIPLAIVNRACPEISQISKPSLFFPSPLDGWRLAGYQTGKLRRVLTDGYGVFIPLEPTNIFLPENTACQAMLREAPIYRADGAFEEGDIVGVVALTSSDITARAAFFRVTNAKCTPLEYSYKI